MDFDNVVLFPYKGQQAERVIQWMRSRNLPDPTKFLEMNAEILKNLPESGMPRWGHGRELIPGFPLTGEELTYFLLLPEEGTENTDSKPEKWRKTHLENIKKGVKRRIRTFPHDKAKELEHRTEEYLDSLETFTDRTETSVTRLSDIVLDEEGKSLGEFGTFIEVLITNFTYYVILLMGAPGRRLVLGLLRNDQKRYDDVKEAKVSENLLEAMRKSIKDISLEEADKASGEKAERITHELLEDFQQFGEDFKQYSQYPVNLPDVKDGRKVLERDITEEQRKRIVVSGKILCLITAETALTFFFLLPDRKSSIVDTVEDILFRQGVFQR